MLQLHSQGRNVAGIVGVGLCDYAVAEIAAQAERRMEVHAPAKDVGELCLQVAEPEAGHAAGFELDSEAYSGTCRALGKVGSADRTLAMRFIS